VTRRARLLALGLALVGTIGVAGLTAAQPLVHAEVVLARLARAMTLAEQGMQQPLPDRMQEVRDALGLPVEVEVAGSRLVLEPDPILERLSGDAAADFERAATRLRVLEDALQGALQREAPRPEQVAEALNRAYQGIAPGAGGPIDAILRTFADVVGWLLNRLSTLVSGAGGGLLWVVIIVIGAAAVLLLRGARLVPERVLPGAASRRSGPEHVNWIARADEAMRIGDLREAVRALYLALLGSLTGRGIVADAPALTVGEARAAVLRSRPGLFPIVERATQSNERVVYGGAQPDMRDVEQLREAAALARRA
jgi:hypothetical protein